MALKSIKVANTNTTLLEVPSGLRYVPMSVFFCNEDDELMDEIEIFLVASGESAAEGDNRIIAEYPIKALDTFIWDNADKLILDGGEKIVVKSKQGDLITATINYVEG